MGEPASVRHLIGERRGHVPFRTFEKGAQGFMHVSPTFENFLCTFLPHSDLSHNNRSVISIIGVFLTIIACVLHR